jgi:hypothetical protein
MGCHNRKIIKISEKDAYHDQTTPLVDRCHRRQQNGRTDAAMAARVESAADCIQAYSDASSAKTKSCRSTLTGTKGMNHAPSAPQHDSVAFQGKIGVGYRSILAKSCDYWDFYRQSSAKIGVNALRSRGFAHNWEQCRIYALFTNDGVFM